MCFDTNKAKTLLEEGGFESGVKMDLRCSCDESSIRVVQILKHTYDAVRIQMTISSYDRTAT